MNPEIRLAFSHPSERAESLAENRPHDRIMLRDHVREAEIGAFQQERGVMQRLRFNVVVEVRPYSKPLADDVDRILSYDRVTDAIDQELAAERLNLLETLAEKLAERILTEPRAEKVFVRIEKLDRGPGALGVEIVREASDQGRRAPDAAKAMMAPLILHLGNDAMASPYLPSWLDQLEAAGQPTILTVGLPDLRPDPVDHALVQRRVDLLSIEQNAWHLSLRDPRCVVVGSRTELDWGLHHEQISVWAPSKLVMDAPNPPQMVTDAAALTAWFAEQMEAKAILAIAAPRSDSLPGAVLAADCAELPLTAL